MHSLTLATLHSARLPLLRARLNRPGRQVTLSFVCTRRSYLTLPGPRLRAALIRLATSEHPLAIEALRRLPEADSVPREWRACRFCRRRGSIEDEPHVLLYCKAQLLTMARHEFLTAGDAASEVFARIRQKRGGWALLDFILHCDAVLVPFAEFVDCVYQLCDSTPILLLRDLNAYWAATLP